jgi:hypothetical protein
VFVIMFSIRSVVNGSVTKFVSAILARLKVGDR